MQEPQLQQMPIHSLILLVPKRQLPKFRNHPDQKEQKHIQSVWIFVFMMSDRREQRN
jgi:hypothetical protein